MYTPQPCTLQTHVHSSTLMYTPHSCTLQYSCVQSWAGSCSEVHWHWLDCRSVPISKAISSFNSCDWKYGFRAIRTLKCLIFICKYLGQCLVYISGSCSCFVTSVETIVLCIHEHESKIPKNVDTFVHFCTSM